MSDSTHSTENVTGCHDRQGEEQTCQQSKDIALKDEHACDRGPFGATEKQANLKHIVWDSGTVDQLLSMRTFARVADLSSFTKAADTLDLSRAVVSTHVADLEKHLGVRLFNRTTRRVTLTPDGSDYLENCRRILSELDAADGAMKRSRDRPHGRLRVDVPSAFGRYLLLPALPKFAARYPEISLEVQYNERIIDLVEEQVDVVVRVAPTGGPHLMGRQVCKTRVLTCASPDYLAARGIPTEPEQLKDHQLIGNFRNAGRRPRKWVFQKGRARRELALSFAVAFNTPESALSAAIHGTGIVQSIDLLVAEALANGKLRVVLQEWSTEGVPISIVFPTAQRNSPKVRAFADFAADLLLTWRRKVDTILAAET